MSARRFSTALFLLAATRFSIAQEPAFRLFFDTKGVSEHAARSADDPLAFTNPVLHDSGRLYLYFEFHLPQHDQSHMNIRFDIEGPAIITDGHFYNHHAIGLERWQNIPSPTPTPGSTSWYPGYIFKVGAGGYGIKNTPTWDIVETQDTHFRQGDDGSTMGTTLLGFIDFLYTGVFGGPDATLKMTFGNGPLCGIIPCPPAYFGFDDPAIPQNSGQTSLFPDAYISPVPEPTTLALCLVAAALRPRRRRSSSPA